MESERKATNIQCLDVTGAYVWAARKKGLSLTTPKLKVCDTPLSQGRSAETLEDVLSPNTPQVYATESFNIVSAVESALKLIPRVKISGMRSW